MVEHLDLVLLLALNGALSTTLNTSLVKYFDYIHSFFFQTILSCFGLYHVEFYQANMNEHLPAVFDQFKVDTHCRAFKHNDFKWADGKQQHYVFLSTPTWTSYIMQLLMLGHWIYVPRDRHKQRVSMLTSKKLVNILVKVVNGIEAKRQCEEVLEADELTFLKQSFDQTKESKGIGYLIRTVLARFVTHEGYQCPEEAAETDLEPQSFMPQPLSQPLVSQPWPETSNYNPGDASNCNPGDASNDNSNGDGDASRGNPSNGDGDAANGDTSNSYTVILEEDRWFKKVSKPFGEKKTQQSIYFQPSKLVIYFMDWSHQDSEPSQICNIVKKSSDAAELLYYHYNLYRGQHLSTVLKDILTSNFKQDILVYLCFLEMLDKIFPEAPRFGDNNAMTTLNDFISFVLDLMNTIYPALVLVIPFQDPKTLKESQVHKWCQVMLKDCCQTISSDAE